MNIRTVQCPSCGGNLNVESVNQSLIYCMYCGASVQLETNHNKGYDMEMGRLDARAEIADELLAKIEKIKPELIRNSLAESRTKEYPSRIYRLKQDLNYTLTGEWKKYLLKPLGIGLVILFGGAIVVVFASSLVPKAVLYILEFIVGGAPQRNFRQLYSFLTDQANAACGVFRPCRNLITRSLKISCFSMLQT